MKTILTFLFLFGSSVFLSAEQEMIGDLSIPFAMGHSKVLGEISCRESSPAEPIFHFDLDNVRIEVTESELIRDLDFGWISGRFPDLKSSENIIQKLRDSLEVEPYDPETENEALRLIKKKLLREWVSHKICSLLQEGKAAVFNKERNSYEKEIILAEYGHQSGPLSGEGGKLFIFKESGICFWKVMEWVS